jgi:pSer/pThr/pTyr-binding forkhead associated (FHA) protein
VGWFVNFDLNSNGVSAELRSGKYFISSKKLRPGDFIIEDDAVSMPHCMVTAVPGDGLYLQDLMSEKGTYICRAGSSQFEPISGQQKLLSGDRIRFGSHEALLVLVPKL